MRTKYFIETAEKAKPYYKKASDLGNFWEEARGLYLLVGAQPAWVPHSGISPQAWKKIEPKQEFLKESLKQLSDCAEVIDHFFRGEKVAYFSSKLHKPIADLNQTSLPSKYIMIEFTDKEGNTKQYPLDTVNRVELQKAINIIDELRPHNVVDEQLGDFLAYATRFLHLNEIEKLPVSKRSSSDHGR